MLYVFIFPTSQINFLKARCRITTLVVNNMASRRKELVKYCDSDSIKLSGYWGTLLENTKATRRIKYSVCNMWVKNWPCIQFLYTLHKARGYIPSKWHHLVGEGPADAETGTARCEPKRNTSLQQKETISLITIVHGGLFYTLAGHYATKHSTI